MANTISLTVSQYTTRTVAVTAPHTTPATPAAHPSPATAAPGRPMPVAGRPQAVAPVVPPATAPAATTKTVVDLQASHNANGIVVSISLTNQDPAKYPVNLYGAGKTFSITF